MAIEHFSKAIEMTWENPNHIYYSNRANSYLHLDRNDQCIIDCDRSIHLDPMYIKSYLRKAKALYNKKMFEEADDVIEIAIQINPDIDDLKKLRMIMVYEIEREERMLPMDHPEM